MATNRYAAPCSVCRARVPARGGNLSRDAAGNWQVTHLSCAAGEPSVISIQIGDHEFIRNARGRCEDAPCCGCCTI